MKKGLAKRIVSLILAIAVGSISIYNMPERQASAADMICRLQASDTENAADWSVQTNLQVGDLQFDDREVTYETIPAFLTGADYIRTAADSKAYSGSLATFTAGGEILVYIALDDRITKQPDWLSTWTDTGVELTNSNRVVFRLYQASFQEGEVVTLGTNGQSAGCVNYTVMAIASDAGSCRGDVNVDGQFTGEDAVVLGKWLVNDASLPAWKTGDFCSDAAIDGYDLCAMKRSLLGQASLETGTTAATTASTTTTTTTTDFKEPIAEVEAPFQVADGLFNQNDTDTLSLSYPDGLATYTVWKAEESGDHYCNGVCLAAYNGKLYCQWQSSEQDEDSADTHVMYAVSADMGKTWTTPQVLAENIEGGYCTSGGWLATSGQLVAYINFWPTDLSPRGGDTYYMTSQDGNNWSEPQQVMMAGNTPMHAIFEQDPHVLASGRIINAAHFQDGLYVCPIYTDDPNGITGWKKGEFTPTDSGAASSVEMEPSSFVQYDGTIVMIFRDQAGSYTKLAAYSQDDGVTWSDAVETEMPDARTKQSAGNLSDGTAFLVGCPVDNSLRSPLAVILSQDGTTFDQAYLLRSTASDPALIYEGTAKRLGFHYTKSLVYGGYLYVGYATNKEAVEISVIPEASLGLN